MKTKQRVSLSILLLALLILAATLRASDFWQKKDYRSWSKEDCTKLLTDSPWASSYTVGRAVQQVVGESSAVAGRESAALITYRLAFWSARPIRQALVRLQQLDPKYERLTAVERQKLDGEGDKLIASEFPDAILIEVTFGASTPVYERQLSHWWQTQPVDDLRKNTYLNAGGRKVSPDRLMVSPGGGNVIRMSFPRELDGKPVVSPDEKEISVEFPSPAVGLVPAERVFLRFDTRKMKLGNGVAI